MSQLARYEFVILIRQDVLTSHVSELQESFKTAIEGQGGQVVSVEYCGLLGLAYPVKRNNRAHFIIFDVETKPGALEELERKLRVSEDVIRFLNIRVEEFGQKPSVLAKSHANREQFGKAQFRQDSSARTSVSTSRASGGASSSSAGVTSSSGTSSGATSGDALVSSDDKVKDASDGAASTHKETI
ncbi:30S ribosomal protein S6 [Candidatus Hepatobacter penaei]|uniref:30S ribosomal protein S6 n=1 Tax=Candidatus Hepatobacter penaei TaxID=1274402 RepID=UPI001C11E95E|nr:30S ribosomal protein S6 [Candidatus Hepatobacter penaei]